MNLSYNWLKELVDFDWTPQELARQLTRVGCCVEEIHDKSDDVLLVAEITSNRPDWLCHHGIAHEIAAILGTRVKTAEPVITESKTASVTDLTSVTVECPDLCPRYTARVIQGVTIAPSPAWLQARLKTLGLAPRNNVVDITNYVLFEMNQPLHAFDYDLLQEHRIVVRRAAEGEKFTSVFDEARTLSNAMCVIADAGRAIALAGVKGGKETGIHDGTKNLLIESAYFPQATTRRSRQQSNLDSDSAYRFERGIDPGAVERASRRAAEMILDMAGGELAEGVIDTNPDLAKPWSVTMRHARCAKVLGMTVPHGEAKRIFTGLGLSIEKDDDDTITVSVPTFRGDLTREADLIEEVARCHGLDNIPDSFELPVAIAHTPAVVAAARMAREVLVGLGYHECLTDSFISAPWTDAVRPAEGFAFPAQTAHITIRNPVREDRPHLRTSLLPGLLEVRRVNRNVKQKGFFEINRVFFGEGTASNEMTSLAITADAGTAALRGAVEMILKEWRVDGILSVEPLAQAPKGIATGTAASFRVGDVTLGVLGVIDASMVKLFDLYEPTAVLELDFGALAALPCKRRFFQPLSRFPATDRDIALMVPENITWAQIESIARSVPDLIESIQLVDCYRGKQIPQGTKSMALRVVYRAEDRSLTDEEANALRDAMVSRLTTGISGASLRA